jgi:hypothetical protein
MTCLPHSRQAFGQRRELAQRLRAVPLERVLPLCGGQPDRHDRHKWHTPAGTLSVTGAKFMNWTLGAGGGGAIDLVMQLQHLDFKGALDWLAGHFPGIPPPQAPAPLIQSGTLYADARANAVFLWHTEQNLPVGAELRGTTQRAWHGLAPGSQKDLGCFAIPLEPRPTVVLCESAIDAISCFALHPAVRCLSTAGARPNPQWLGPLLDQGCQVYCGFDADPTGDAMAQAMVCLHPAVQRLRPSRHDWNDVLRARD